MNNIAQVKMYYYIYCWNGVVTSMTEIPTLDKAFVLLRYRICEQHKTFFFRFSQFS